jgi:hypothetical protein
MKQWIIGLLILLSAGCTSDPWQGTFEGEVTESWQIADGMDSNVGSLQRDGIRLALSKGDGDELLATFDDLALEFKKPREGDLVIIESQHITRKLNNIDVAMTLEGELRLLSDGGASLSLVGTPDDGGLSGSYVCDFSGNGTR